MAVACGGAVDREGDGTRPGSGGAGAGAGGGAASSAAGALGTAGAAGSLGGEALGGSGDGGVGALVTVSGQPLPPVPESLDLLCPWDDPEGCTPCCNVVECRFADDTRICPEPADVTFSYSTGTSGYQCGDPEGPFSAPSSASLAVGCCYVAKRYYCY